MTFAKKYRLAGDCFLGEEGDIVTIDWNHYDGALWHNLNKNTMGCPVNQKEIELLIEQDN